MTTTTNSNPLITVKTPKGERRVRLSTVISKLWPSTNDDAERLRAKLSVAARVPHKVARADLIDALYDALEDAA